MPDLPPPPPPKGSLPQADPQDHTSEHLSRNYGKLWFWVAGGVVIALIAAAAVAAQRGEETTQAEAEEEHPVADPTPSPTPTPTPAEIIYPETFNWTVPDVIGMTKNEARAVIQDSVASAETTDIEPVSFGEAYDLRVSIHWSERESQEPKGTVLDMPRYEAGDELTLTPTNNATRGDRVTINVGLVAATPPIRFPGDSIYIDGAGSAMVTWLDSNFDIHQKTVSLPAWFRVPAGVENYNAQRSLGDGGTIECQLRYDDKVYARSRSSGPYTICSVSA